MSDKKRAAGKGSSDGKRAKRPAPLDTSETEQFQVAPYITETKELEWTVLARDALGLAGNPRPLNQHWVDSTVLNLKSNPPPELLELTVWFYQGISIQSVLMKVSFHPAHMAYFNEAFFAHSCPLFFTRES